MKMKSLLTLLTMVLTGQVVTAQNVYSPSVNALKYKVQAHRAASTETEQQRAVFTVTCSADASLFTIANQMKGMGGEIRTVMGNQLLVDLPMARLDEMAAIDGVLLVDMPRSGHQRTDTARKASQVDEAHAGNAEGLPDLPQAYTGKGVIIGVIDGGFDFTHPIFKDKDGNLRIKGVFIACDESNRDKGENLDDIPMVTASGETINQKVMGEFFTDPNDILDTLVCKDPSGAHGTHCASIAAGSIMDYKNGFTGKYATSGKIGGMAPDAELYLALDEISEEQEEKYPELKDNLGTINNMQALSVIRHFAEKEGKPLVVSWSANNHDGFHDGTSSMARFIGNYCNQGNIMALCASNEGADSMYMDHTISMGKTQKWVLKKTNSSFGVDAFIKTCKEVKLDLVIVDQDYNPVYTCNLPLTSSAKQDSETKFEVTVKTDEAHAPDDDFSPVTVNDDIYKNVGDEVAKYIKEGKLSIGINKGVGLDNNNQNFDYVNIHVEGEGLNFLTDEVTEKEEYLPMLLITSPNEDVRIQGWGDYCNIYANSMDDENTFKPGTAENSMGDWNTSGEPVTIGAYTTDRSVINPYYPDDSDKPLVESPREVVGRYASFSSFGHDFSEARRAYPDVSAPGYAIYAASNSFVREDQFRTAEYSGQFKGQKEPRKYPYAIMSGTSMSTPAAAGIMALWVQAAMEEKGKKLTNADIKDIIAHSSVTDDYTKDDPLRYGAGKMNAYKGLLYVLGIETSIPELPSRHIGATLNGRTLHISGDLDTQVTVYNLSGQKVLDAKADAGIVELPNLPAGVYAVKIGNQGSTLVRL